MVVLQRLPRQQCLNNRGCHASPPPAIEQCAPSYTTEESASKQNQTVKFSQQNHRVCRGGSAELAAIPLFFVSPCHVISTRHANCSVFSVKSKGKTPFESRKINIFAKLLHRSSFWDSNLKDKG